MSENEDTDRITYLTEDDMQAFCDAVNNPKPLTDKFKNMMRDYSDKVRSGQIIIDGDLL